MDEEDGSADDDEHIRTALFAGAGEQTRADKQINEQTANGVNHGAHGGSGMLEKFRIEYPKKYHNVRSMSLSMERNAFCDLCRVSRSTVQFDSGTGINGGEDGRGCGSDDDQSDDKVPRYFGFTVRQYMALGSLALVDFLGFCSMSIMAPTFPKEVITTNRTCKPL